MSNNYVDIKVTVWSRLYFSENADMQKIVNLIKENSVEDIINDEYGFLESEILFDTEQHMLPEENDQQSTIEVFQLNEMI